MKPVKAMPEEDEKVMTLWEHVEELRWIVFKILIVFLLASGIGLFFVDGILEILLAPLKHLMQKSMVRLNQSGPFDGIMIKMKASILAGVIISLPFTVIFLWSFIAPAVNEKNRKAFWWVFSSISLLFMSGFIAGYYLLSIIMPIMVSFSVEGAENLWKLREYIDFTFLWLLGSGLVFQLPLLIFVLARLGIIKVGTFRKSRKYALMVAFILAAILTPSPDAITQMLVGIPIYLLYEIGILASSFEKKDEGE